MVGLQCRHHVLDGTFYEDTADKTEALAIRVSVKRVVQRAQDKSARKTLRLVKRKAGLEVDYGRTQLVFVRILLEFSDLTRERLEITLQARVILLNFWLDERLRQRLSNSIFRGRGRTFVAELRYLCLGLGSHDVK